MTAVPPIGPINGPLAVFTQGLSKTYGKDVALREVNLRVPEGAVYVLAGPNGAGKTTLLEILLDLVKPDAGVAEIFGLNVRECAPTVRAQIGYVSARQSWGYGWMRVGRLLKHHAVFYPTWDEAYAAHLTRLFDLRLDQKYGTLSKGHARRAQLVLALAHRPPLLLLDEPTDGLDRVIRDKLIGILVEHLAETSTTILLSTHLIYEVDALADHLGILHEGRLVTQVCRDRLQRMLHRYRADVPEGWTPPRSLNQAIVWRVGSGREIQWVIWGEEAEVARCLTRSGATLRETRPLTLDDAALALLRNTHPILVP